MSEENTAQDTPATDADVQAQVESDSSDNGPVFDSGLDDQARLDAFTSALPSFDDAGTDPTSDQLDLSGEKKADEEPPSDDKESSTPEEDEEAKKEAEESDGDEKEDGEPPGYKWAALRRREGKLEQDRQQLQAQAQRFEQERQEQIQRINAAARDLESANQLFNSDPEAFVDFIAKANGLTGAQFYDRLTERRLNDGNPAGSEMMDEIRALRNQIQELESGQRNWREQQQITAQQQHAQRVVQGWVDEVNMGKVTMPDRTVVPLEKWQHLNALPAPTRESKVREGIAWAAQNAPHLTFPELLDSLDDIAKEEYLHWQQTFSARGMDTPAEKRNPEGSRDPAPSAKPDSPKGTTLSNSHAAQTSQADVYRHDSSDRISAAAAALPEHFSKIL